MAFAESNNNLLWRLLISWYDDSSEYRSEDGLSTTSLETRSQPPGKKKWNELKFLIWNVACFLPANRDVCLLSYVHCENFALYHNKRLLRADPCCRSVIKEFAHAFSCAYIELWMHLGSLKSTQKAGVALGCASRYSYALCVLSKLPACIHNSIYARQVWTNSQMTLLKICRKMNLPVKQLWTCLNCPKIGWIKQMNKG